ncbi:MAG TPA: TerC family protein [Longimicrobiales bacterium]|nr:TerC family protein [Longimicrobiales bacterium]
MATSAWYWIVFNAFVLLLLVFDLGVFHRKAHRVGIREALAWSAVWITLSLAFNYGIYHFFGSERALSFLAGYLIEKSLSVDNLFVFAVVLTYFSVPSKYQHKVLFWGILGALLMRAVMIMLGAALIARFHWVVYIFGVFLIFTGIRMGFRGDEQIEPEKNVVLRLARRFLRITPEYHEGAFFVKLGRHWFATPLFVVLLVIETTDLLFAVDSIPAIFAITTDPFIVYTSNIFAILGLRSLYFALAAVLDLFHYLKVGLAVVLVFVGLKMLLADVYKVPIGLALGVVGGILLLSIAASLIWPPKDAGERPSTNSER